MYSRRFLLLGTQKARLSSPNSPCIWEYKYNIHITLIEIYMVSISVVRCSVQPLNVRFFIGAYHGCDQSN